MSALPGVADPALAGFGIDAAALTGTLPIKLAAVRAAGFAQLALSARDLTGHFEGVDAAIAAVRASGLRVAALQELRDFEGLSGRLHDYKVAVARSLLEMAAALECSVVVACSSTLPDASADPDAVARDLRKLAMLALPLGIRVAYEALSWGRVVRDLPGAWDAVLRTDMPNLGLVLDTYHLFAAQTPLEALEEIDPAKIFFVQLADVLFEAAPAPGEVQASSRWRVFPGEGTRSGALADLMKQLDRLGYRGDYGFEVGNEDFLPPASVAARARRSALWLAEDVLRRSAPLPGAIRLRAVGGAK